MRTRRNVPDRILVLIAEAVHGTEAAARDHTTACVVPPRQGRPGRPALIWYTFQARKRRLHLSAELAFISDGMQGSLRRSMPESKDGARDVARARAQFDHRPGPRGSSPATIFRRQRKARRERAASATTLMGVLVWPLLALVTVEHRLPSRIFARSILVGVSRRRGAGHDATWLTRKTGRSAPQIVSGCHVCGGTLSRLTTSAS